MDTLPTPSALEDDLLGTANLHPRTTDLPMTVRVSPGRGALHDARVQVSLMGGDRMVPEDAAVVGIRPEPRLMEGDLGRMEWEAVSRWIGLTRQALPAFWEGEIDTIELRQRLVRG